MHIYIAAKSLQSCPTLCNPIDGSPPGSSVPGILQARTLEWVAISFSNAWKLKWSRSVVSDSVRPHGLQPTRLLHPWDFPGKSTGVGCHCLLRYIYRERYTYIAGRFFYCLSCQRSTGRQNNIFENCSYSSRLYGYTLYYWMKENIKKLKVDCKYEFLYNKLPLPTDFYYKMKDAFLWIMKVDVGDTM